MKKELTLVKVGGKIVEEKDSLERLLQRFTMLPGHKVLVHGGGRTATDVATRLGVETRMVNGRRITDEAMLRIVTMVYGGLVNKQVVAHLQAHRRPAGEVDYGFVGDVDYVNGKWLATLIEQGAVPVMAPLTHDGHGSLLNTNADTIAGETAKALAPYFDVSLIYCFEKKGVLLNPDDDESVIPHIHRSDFPRMVTDGTVTGGMIPKIENALAAVAAGVGRVIITCADSLGQPEAGTLITE